MASADILNDRVLPFFDEHGIPLCRVLTDRECMTWYPGNAEGLGGIYNFVTKRALCQGKRS